MYITMELIGMAEFLAEYSECVRRQIGCVITDKDNIEILGTGSNTMARGCKRCKDIGCMRIQASIPSGEQAEKCRAVHAEQNAILSALSKGHNLTRANLYCTHKPCVICAKLIIQSGIKEIYYINDYPDVLSAVLLEEAGVKITKVDAVV